MKSARSSGPPAAAAEDDAAAAAAVEARGFCLPCCYPAAETAAAAAAAATSFELQEETKKETLLVDEATVERLPTKLLNELIEDAVKDKTKTKVQRENSFSVSKGIVSFASFLVSESYREQQQQQQQQEAGEEEGQQQQQQQQKDAAAPQQQQQQQQQLSDVPQPLSAFLPPSPFFVFDGQLGIDVKAFKMDFQQNPNFVPSFYIPEGENYSPTESQTLKKGLSRATQIDLFGEEDLAFIADGDN
ncbi:hypothetical protein, conserved [Eimeria tenella]|uniref:Uncharacterized protein n=1 Tax=Eimeria tenella TaxID=5802 RepID=U6KXR8_EIMTE|nr:hypothetical protein, conserved [Eimeria tenella]CDJ41743.1 hypothetical protein, conserved [Eimeria tenella]|eukprot:XP_013232493.1 hypothetical protein, conserved [Eimeria tenella]